MHGSVARQTVAVKSQMSSKSLTRIGNVVPIRRVKLVVAGQNLQKEVLVATVRVVLVAVVVERRVSGQAGEWVGEKKSSAQETLKQLRRR